MSQYASEMLSADEVVALWSEIRPLLAESVLGNELTAHSLTPEHILGLVAVGECGIVGFFESGRLSLVLAIQFSQEGADLVATILAFAGRDMLLFKRLYWNYVTDWLAANGVSYIETLANPRMARIFKNKFGFSQSSVCLRKPLKEFNHG